METTDMGRVLTEATIENLKDLWAAERGLIPITEIRCVHVKDALVDTGATALALPKRYIEQLGLSKKGERRTTSAQGSFMIPIYEAVRLTIMGRDMPLDVMEVPDDIPVLIGQIPLEMFDLVVDPQSRRLIGNPAHGGVQTLELYRWQGTRSNPAFAAFALLPTANTDYNDDARGAMSAGGAWCSQLRLWVAWVGSREMHLPSSGAKPLPYPESSRLGILALEAVAPGMFCVRADFVDFRFGTNPTHEHEHQPDSQFLDHRPYRPR